MKLDKNAAVTTGVLLAAVEELIRSHIAKNVPKTDGRHEWRSSLMDIVNDVLREADDGSDAGETAEYLWTSAKKIKGVQMELCSILNAALREDEPDRIAHAVIFASAINLRRVESRALQKGGPKIKYPREITAADGVDTNMHLKHYTCACWRGGGFPARHKAFFRPGKKYRVPQFLATSLNRATAMRFVLRGKKNTRTRALWCIKVDQRGVNNPDYRCKHASFVHKSLVPGEGEFLFTPYSTFTVESVDFSDDAEYYKIVVIAAQDNKKCREDLPLAPYS